jgi:hypothetical protein
MGLRRVVVVGLTLTREVLSLTDPQDRGAGLTACQRFVA